MYWLYGKVYRKSGGLSAWVLLCMQWFGRKCGSGEALMTAEKEIELAKWRTFEHSACQEVALV